MHLFGSRRSSPGASLAAVLFVSALILQCCAASSRQDPASFSPPQRNAIFVRDEDVGSSCDTEGQWNCMTDSWQRCAAGQWSKVIQCAEDTKCEPSGLTMEFRIEFDNGTDANSSSSSTTNTNHGPRETPSQALAFAAFWLCALAVVI